MELLSTDREKISVTIHLDMPQKSKLNLKPLELGPDSIGRRIAKLRKARGYTQIELAEKIGLTQNLVSSYEIDRLRLSAEMAIRFAEALEVSTDELFGRQKKSTPEKKPSRKIIRRLELIEKLPPAKQTVLLKTIDTFIKGVGA